MYTDCFKLKKGTGAGVFSNDLNIKVLTTLDNLNTIFQPECVGIIKVARDMTDSSIRIVSDSASMLQAQQNNEMKEMMLQTNTQA